MQIKYLLIAGLFTISACKCKHTQTTGTEQEKPVYVYQFEKTAPLTADNTKKLISDFLGEQKTTDLTVSADENIAYFVSAEDVNTTLEQDLNNGNFAFSKLNKAYLGDLKPQLPSENDAVKISEDYLRGKGLFPKNGNELVLVHKGGVRAQAVGGPVIDKMITLTYGRVVDSMQVIGAGSKIIVNIGDKGEVVGVTRRWRELNTGEKRTVKQEETISREEAEAQAKRQILQEFGQQATYEVKSVMKSYYDNNGSYLQPVYAFETVINLNSREKGIQPIRYLCVIPMLKESPEPLSLTKLDPKAKERLKAIDQQSIDTTDVRDRKTRD
ncbi:MAG TPA: hypothetical protein VJ720_13335 [Chitinophaga sp.]|nr:hypothetical protein [Chitinophaga sp.]